MALKAMRSRVRPTAVAGPAPTIRKAAGRLAGIDQLVEDFTMRRTSRKSFVFASLLGDGIALVQDPYLRLAELPSRSLKSFV